MSDGIIAVHDLKVISHRTRNTFLPRRLKVRDVMTPSPRHITTSSPLDQVVRALLSSVFTGMPVVDHKQHPIGIVTQGDLIRKGGLPLRLGLLAASDPNRLNGVFTALALRQAKGVMTTPAICIHEDPPLGEAVGLMLSKELKRLPVVDHTGRLTGILSRLDIFKTVMREAPDWKSFCARKIEVQCLRFVRDIVRRDSITVTPETPVDEVIQVIDHNDLQRVAVVDPDGCLLGIIADYDLLHYFKPEYEGIWGLLAKTRQAFTGKTCRADMVECLARTTAAAVMNTQLTTVTEDMLIEEAMGLMTEKALKRLPVVDDVGRFKGMISRESLLRTGFNAGQTDRNPAHSDVQFRPQTNAISKNNDDCSDVSET